MNAPLVTRAAEGWDRRAFTVAEVSAMKRAGILDDEVGYELWEGEIVPMSPKKNRHEIWKRQVDRWPQRALPDAFAFAVEPALYLSEIILLAIEISDSSILRDLGPKARLYARHGVRVYWVLDADGRRAVAHTEPGREGYGRIQEFSGEAVLTLPFEPALEIRLADLG